MLAFFFEETYKMQVRIELQSATAVKRIKYTELSYSPVVMLAVWRPSIGGRDNDSASASAYTSVDAGTRKVSGVDSLLASVTSVVSSTLSWLWPRSNEGEFGLPADRA